MKKKRSKSVESKSTGAELREYLGGGTLVDEVAELDDEVIEDEVIEVEIEEMLE